MSNVLDFDSIMNNHFMFMVRATNRIGYDDYVIKVIVIDVYHDQIMMIRNLFQLILFSSTIGRFATHL